MPDHLLKGLFALVVSSVFALHPAFPQRHRSNNLEENIQLPPDFAIDYQLGLTIRNQVHGSSTLLIGTPMNLAGDTVFQSLISSSGDFLDEFKPVTIHFPKP